MTRRLVDEPRVFCIGWHKTGTTTLGLALIKLGYSVLGCRLDMVHALRRGEDQSLIDLVGQFDAVQDVPWAALYRDLDEQFPGSKFILTQRDPQAWLKSASRHFASTDIPLHAWLYGQGVLKGNESLYLERYLKHNDAVKTYFAKRPDDLLVLDLEAGDGWAELCRFLGKPHPGGSFPHENKSARRRNFRERCYARLKSWVPMTARVGFLNLRVWIRALRGLPDPRNRFHNFRENRAERATWPEHSDTQ